jgi:hypothetical protein
VLGWAATRDLILGKIYKDINWGPYNEQGIEKVRKQTDRQLLTASRILDRVVGLPDFAKAVESERHYMPRMLSTIYSEHVAQIKSVDVELDFPTTI